MSAIRDEYMAASSPDTLQIKLRDIVTRARYHSGFLGLNKDQAVAQILQVTSQEFFARFKAELPKHFEKYPDIERAARRAAGVSE